MAVLILLGKPHAYRGFHIQKDSEGWFFNYGIARVANSSLRRLRQLIDVIVEGGAL